MENTENLSSDLENDIKAAKKAVQYFESLAGAVAALAELVKHQADFALITYDELVKTQNERNNVS